IDPQSSEFDEDFVLAHVIQNTACLPFTSRNPAAYNGWVGLYGRNIRIHESTVFVKANGDGLSSNGEVAADNWMSRSLVIHEVHTLLNAAEYGEFQLSFKIMTNKGLHVPVWLDICQKKGH
ncbi:MAG: hypothetical protein ACXAEI_14680, partial [Candidatus Hodarchaeales archaeon]